MEKVFDIFNNELEGVRGRTGDRMLARGLLFIKFLVLEIRVSMNITIALSRMKSITVENALMSASTYDIIKDRGIHVISEKTKRVKEIFELFGVDDSEQLHLPYQAP